jgi:preprotein translocase SecE subunit
MQITKFIREVKGEMKYVKWPTRNMIIGSTIAVLLISAVTAALLSGEDMLLQKLLAKLLAK